MSNDRLKAAMRAAGLEVDQLAEAIGADPKTVQRWVSGRLPRGRYRTAVARALDTTELELWPEAGIPKTLPARLELVGAFARTADVLAPDWKTLIRNAREQIDLLDYTLIETLASPGLPELLASKADHGCQIRLLVSYATRARLATDTPLDDEYQDDPPRAAFEIARARAYINQLVEHDRIEARKFAAPRFNSIVRVDEQMLVTLHLWGTPGPEAPLLHLRQENHPGLFEQFEQHYQAIWEDGSHPIEPEPDLFPDPDDQAAYEGFVFDDPPPDGYEQ